MSDEEAGSLVEVPAAAAPDGAPAPPEPGPCNGLALRRATRRVSQLYDAALAPSGLRGTQRSILATIARADRPSMGDLAAALVLDRSALAHNVKPLVRDGLVRLLPDERDGRSRRAVLTGAGRARLEASRPLWEAAQARFEAAFGAERARDLRAVLAVIAGTEFGAAGTEVAAPEPAEDAPTRS